MNGYLLTLVTLFGTYPLGLFSSDNLNTVVGLVNDDNQLLAWLEACCHSLEIEVPVIRGEAAIYMTEFCDGLPKREELFRAWEP